MHSTDSFGYWLRRRRKACDLTQRQLAEIACCAAATIRKLEADERRPSAQLAARLATALDLAPAERAAFLQAARGVLRVDNLARASGPVDPATALGLLALFGAAYLAERGVELGLSQLLLARLDELARDLVARPPLQPGAEKTVGT